MTHFILDCDDTLLDWLSGFREYLADRDIYVDPASPTTWSLAEWIGCGEASALSWVRRFNTSPAFAKLKPLPGAVEFVKSLKAAGHSASVLTCCGPASKRARVINLNAVFGHKSFKWIVPLEIGESKLEYLFQDDAFVDDAFHHAKGAANMGMKTYCLRKPHNAGMSHWGVTFIDDLREIPI